METYKRKTFLYRMNKFWRDYCTDYKGTPLPFIWIHKFNYWFKYTFIKPFNVLKIKTLPKGPWVDKDEVLLHAAFQILTDFMVHECIEGKCYYRDLQMIDIEANMKSVDEWDEVDKKSIRESLEHQNKCHMEICDLYEWWIIKRPIRQKSDPFTLEKHEESIILDLNEDDEVDSRDEYGDPLTYKMNWHASSETKAYYDRQNAYEEMCDREDEEMLIRLMKIRKFMWT